jgi:hypothetical protein
MAAGQAFCARCCAIRNDSLCSLIFGFWRFFSAPCEMQTFRDMVAPVERKLGITDEIN